MDAADVWAADGLITRAIGDEIRRARHSAGWSRAELAARMPTDVHVRTIAAYEQGERQCAIPRLVELCLVLGVVPSELLQLALYRVELLLPHVELQVDLRALIRDDREGFGRLRDWARKRLERDARGSGVARLNHAVVDEMAVWLDYSRPALLQYLSAFRPRAAS